MKIVVIFTILCIHGMHSNAQTSIVEYTKDKDIQEALIAVLEGISMECPIVISYDEQMPDLSVSHILMKQMQEQGRMFMVLNLSGEKLGDLEKLYGTRNPSDILQNLLHILYRKRHCYTFLFWVKDPRILYPETNTKYHPGWRRTDKVILLAHHITKRYKSLIALRFWKHIPNIIGLKRSKEDAVGVAINIFTVLPYFKNGKRKPHEIDVWLVPQEEFLHNNELFFDKFTNFHNASVVLGVLWKEPFFIWGNKNDPYLDGLDWRLFHICKEQLNFTFAINTIGTAGRKVGNDSWTPFSMFGKLANGSIDLGGGGISVTAERLQYFDFCRTYYTDSYKFIVPLNKEVNTALTTFMHPLSEEVWIAVFISSLIALISLKIAASLEHHFKSSDLKKNKFPDIHFTSYYNNVDFLVTLFCQKPYRYLPKTLAVQCIYYGISLTIFVLGMAFSSCLISVLLGFQPKPLADEIEDILKTKMQISIRNYDGHLNDYMQNSANPILREIFRKATMVDYYSSFEAMDNVVKGGQIYIDSNAKIHFSGKYRYSGSNGLKFHISSGAIVEFANLGWPVNKNWPFIWQIDKIISRAVEGGLVQNYMNQFMRGKFGGSDEAWRIPEEFNLLEKEVRAQEIDPSEEKDEKFVRLNSSHIGGVIVLYFAGIFIALFAFTIECLAGLLSVLSKWIHRKSKNVSKPEKSPLVVQVNVKPSELLKLSPLRIRNVSNSKTKVEKVKQVTQPKNVNPIPKTEIIKQSKTKKSRNHRKSQFPELVWSDFNVHY